MSYPRPVEEITLIGREYIRVSDDRTGRGASPASQSRANRRAFGIIGKFLDEAYAETEAMSASEFGTRIRGGFQRLLDDLNNGRFGATVLIVWEISRASRQKREWLILIDACITARVRIFVTSENDGDGRLYDPADPDDEDDLIEAAIQAGRDSRRTSKRTRRHAADAAEDGLAWGACPFGFRRIYEVDPHSGRRTIKAQIPERDRDGQDEAAIIAELFDRVWKRHTFRAIYLDFKKRGIHRRPFRDRSDKSVPRKDRPMISGEPFTEVGLRQMVLNPAYVGLRVHQTRNEHGRYNRKASLDGAVPAMWKGLVSEETFWAVRHMLVTRDPGGQKKGKSLLSGIGRCGECGSVLAFNNDRYKCRARGCSTIDAADLDFWFEEHMFQYLADPDVIRKMSKADEPALAAARAAVERAESELEAMYSDPDYKALSLRGKREHEEGLTASVSAAKEHERELGTPHGLGWLLEAGPAGVHKRWGLAPMSAKRDAARLLLTPDAMRVLVLRKAPGRKPLPVEDRAEFRNEGV